MNNLLKLSLAVSMAFFAMSSEGRAEDVKIGVIYDATGPLATQSTAYAKGIQAAISSLNANGGINGKKIVGMFEDYGYQIPRALVAYKKLKGEGVIAVQGSGSGDTEALMDTVTRDKMPYFSNSHSPRLADPKLAPYNYFAGADFSMQARSGLKHMADNWADTTRRPRLAVIYTDNAYGKGVLPAIESYADEVKIDVVGKEVVNPGALDAVSAVTRLKDLKPDYIWLQQVGSAVAVIVRDAKKVGLDAAFYGGVWTYDPGLIDLAGPAIEGLISVQVGALSAQGLPAEEAMKAVAENSSDLDDSIFIRGWVAMIVVAEGMKAADKAGNLTGEGIKMALDSGTPIDVGGLMAPVVYTSTDHRSSDTSFLYQIKDRKPVFLGEVTLERRPEWLGQ